MPDDRNKVPKYAAVTLMRPRRLRPWGDPDLQIFKAGDTVTVAMKDAMALLGANVARLAEDDDSRKAKVKGRDATLGPEKDSEDLGKKAAAK